MATTTESATPTTRERIASTTSSTSTTSTSTTTSTTSTTVAATTTVPGSQLALDVLALIPVANEQQDGYDRDRFGYGFDVHGDGCDTRAEVLVHDSITPAQVDPSGCQRVTGSRPTRCHLDRPRRAEIDHVVALKEAHDSGAGAWQPNRLVAFGNDLDDPRSLRAVTSAVNGAKSDADPSNGLPPDESYLCTSLGDHLE